MSKEQKCRVCGCTEDNCSQCIKITGHPCHWVEPDLCSACQDAITNQQKSKDMNFFQNLYELIDGVDVTIEAKRIDGKLKLRVLPKCLANIKSVEVTGTPEELNEGFFDAIAIPVNRVKGMKVEQEQFFKSIEEVQADNARKLKEAAAKKPDKPADKPAASKAANKKAKPADKKPVAKKDVCEPEPALF